MCVYTTVQKFKVSVFLMKYFYSAMMHSVVSSHSKDIRLKYKTLKIVIRFHNIVFTVLFIK